MTDARNYEKTVQAAWQAEPAEEFMLKESEMHAQLTKFQRQIKWRNILEYAAGAAVLVVFGAYAINLESIWMKIGSLLLIIGTVFLLTNLHFRAGRREAPPDFESRSFYISELERQRDALKSVWLWYVAPLVPGLIVFRIGVHLSELQSHPYVFDAVGVGILGLVLWLNARAVKRLQRKIDEARQLLEIDDGEA